MGDHQKSHDGQLECEVEKASKKSITFSFVGNKMINTTCHSYKSQLTQGNAQLLKCYYLVFPNNHLLLHNFMRL